MAQWQRLELEQLLLNERKIDKSQSTVLPTVVELKRTEVAVLAASAAVSAAPVPEVLQFTIAQPVACLSPANAFEVASTGLAKVKLIAGVVPDHASVPFRQRHVLCSGSRGQDHQENKSGYHGVFRRSHGAVDQKYVVSQ